MFVMRSAALDNPQPRSSSQDYEGLKSEPEDDLTIPTGTLRVLDPFLFRARVFDTRARDVPLAETGEGLSLYRLEPNGLSAGHALVAPQDHIDIERIELDAAADPARLLGRNQRRA